MKNKCIIFGIIISIGIIIALTGCCVNVSEWPSQIFRRINLSSTIEPSHPLVIELNVEFDQYFANKKAQLENAKSSDFEKISWELNYVEMFIDEIIEPSVDLANEFHPAIDHYPSIAQILDTQKDDCDGRAFVACSLLIHRGYDSYVIINVEQ